MFPGSLPSRDRQVRRSASGKERNKNVKVKRVIPKKSMKCHLKFIKQFTEKKIIIWNFQVINLVPS